jgi:hypothetical protein
MEAITLVAGLLLPWWLGVAFVLALRPARQAAGEFAWVCGAGYLAGAFLLTLWMRALSLAGVKFGGAAIALPLVAVAIACTILAWRRDRAEPQPWRTALRALVAPPDLAAAARAAWWLLIAWLVVRFALLGVELWSRPLYPWDAWTQWGTKARVWYELGYVAPFARVEAWLAANGAVYFDASPEYPPTMPLLQVWSCISLGRWDDTLMNGPWWLLGIALTLAVYGGLRALGASALAALVGAFFVASLPLANVHVALAGYADLPMAAYFTAAALALLRWSRSRDAGDAGIALLLAIACTQIKNPGWFWAATLVPGLVVAMWPRQGVRIAFASFAVAGIALVALARFKLRLFNYDLSLSYAPAWGDLADSYFLLGNWNLLWYGAIAAALLAWRQLLAPALAPLTTIVAGGLIFLFVVFGFTTASLYISDQTTVNRATLHLAPLIAVFIVLAWQAFAQRWMAVRTSAGDPRAVLPAAGSAGAAQAPN